MTPKEKAEQLYNAYKKALNINNDMRAGANPFAKQCALICVEEILTLARESQDPDHIAWWEEVKQEIEKL